MLGVSRDSISLTHECLLVQPLSRIAGMMPGVSTYYTELNPTEDMTNAKLTQLRPCFLQMPDYLVPKSGDQQATDRLRKFMVIMDSMNKAELDGKVDLHDKLDPQVESRILRIARGAGCAHPNEVRMLLQAHKQFEGMIGTMGKSGMLNNNSKMGMKQQAQLQAQMRKNPNFINQRLNAMDPKLLAQMGGREHVANMMQQMAKGNGPGGNGMPDMSSAMSAMMGGAAAAGGGGMPDMSALNAMMGGGGGGGMPDMSALQSMMGGGGGGAGGAGGMDMQAMMQAMQNMGMGGGAR